MLSSLRLLLRTFCLSFMAARCLLPMRLHSTLAALQKMVPLGALSKYLFLPTFYVFDETAAPCPCSVLISLLRLNPCPAAVAAAGGVANRGCLPAWVAAALGPAVARHAPTWLSVACRALPGIRAGSSSKWQRPPPCGGRPAARPAAFGGATAAKLSYVERPCSHSSMRPAPDSSPLPL